MQRPAAAFEPAVPARATVWQTGLGVALSFGAAAPGCTPARTAIEPRRPPAFELAASPVPACPRDAAPGRTGQCACADALFNVLGACVGPRSGDAYCGPGARIESGGCAFRACGPRERVDLATGECVSPPAIWGASGCSDGGALRARGGRWACIPPAAACPRDSTREDGTIRACARARRCPPGSLFEEPGRGQHPSPARSDSPCRPFVFEGTSSELRRVDVAVWASVAVGLNGGHGSSDLCRPLEQESLEPGASPALWVHVLLAFPHQDVSRAHAAVEVRDEAGRAPSLGAQETARRSLETLVEILRALGGEASAASVETRVRCLASLAPSPPGPAPGSTN